MNKPIHLTLMIGPGLPIPVPREVLDALTSIQVNANAGDAQSGFELNFTVSKRSPLHTLFLVSGGAGIPFVRVVVVVTLNGTPHVLIDGMMTHHQFAPGNDGSSPTLRVQGKDLSTVMTYLDSSGLPYPAMPPAARVLLVVAKYAAFGIVPVVIPSIVQDIPLPTQYIPRHKGKDLEYIQQLALECGYVFYVEPGPVPGVNFAYWGPEIKIGRPQPALNIDMDAHTNVESMSFNVDKEKKEMPRVEIRVNKAVIPIPILDITPLNPPLGLIPPLPPRQPKKEDLQLANLPPARAFMRGLAYASRHADAVFGTGSLDTVRYGRILKSRKLVGVRGAGMAFDGLYYVTSVTHKIKRGEYKQDFTLARNGVISTLSTVPV